MATAPRLGTSDVYSDYLIYFSEQGGGRGRRVGYAVMAFDEVAAIVMLPCCNRTHVSWRAGPRTHDAARSASWVFMAGDLERASSVRQEIGQFLAGIGIWDSDATSRAVLAAHEVVANAIVHGAGTVVVVAFLDDEFLTVEVSDCSPVLPVPSSSMAWDAESGRGLMMLEALGARWRVQRGEEGKGKTVHLYVDRYAKSASMSKG